MKKTLKTFLTVGFLSAAAIFTTACSSTGAAPATAASSAAPQGGTKPYPLSTCIVTDNDLGSMGDEQRMVYQGREIKFCCKPCMNKFMKNPAKYLQKLS